MRILLPLIAFLLLAGSASSQIYAMEFKEQKYAKGYKKNLFEWNGRQVVLVEVRGGLGRGADGGFTWKPNDRIDFYVQNQGDPLDLAYKIDKEGFLKVKKKSLTVGISGDRFKGLTGFMMNESFHTLAIAYQRRLDSLEALERRRDESEKGSAAWFSAHDQLVTELELLQSWLAQTGYVKAANKLDRDIHRQRKLISEAKTARIENALSSIELVDTDPKLTEVAHKLGGPTLDFHTQESQHIRIIYHNGISDGVITRLLELGETAIDGFRTQFVDPYLGDDYKDYIPDDMFMEFFFSTDQMLHYEKFFEDYWGQNWGSGERRQQRLAITGNLFMHGKLYTSYSRTEPDADLEGRIVHTIGHRLANFHYQMPRGDQEWLEEGVGFYLSFNYLNRNSLNCVAFKPPPRKQGGTVAKGGKTKAKKDESKTQTIMRGLRDVMAGVAMNAGVPMSQLVPKRRYDFENEDTAKAWAFYSFLADSTGKEGQLWLRSLSEIMFADDFQLKIRQLTEKLFGLEGGDPMEKFEEQWKQYLRDNYEV
ncbi:MAG: hypothetical protein ACYTEP_10500 [Planctomycetota bacterium]|jgi:hypothetical protein